MVSKSTHKVSESRKIRKPLMEKKRRARINDSLEALKQMLLESTTSIPQTTSKNSNNNRPAKLEKADILEMTVRYLQDLHQRLGPNNSSQINAKPIRKNLFGTNETKPIKCVPILPKSPDLYSSDSNSSSIGHSSRESSPVPFAQSPETISQVYTVQPIVQSSNSNIFQNVQPIRITQFGIPIAKLANGDLAFIIPSATTTTNAHACKKVNSNNDVKLSGNSQVWRPW